MYGIQGLFKDSLWNSRPFQDCANPASADFTIDGFHSRDKATLLVQNNTKRLRWICIKIQISSQPRESLLFSSTDRDVVKSHENDLLMWCSRVDHEHKIYISYLRGHIIRSKLWRYKITAINLRETKICKLYYHVLARDKQKCINIFL